MQVPARRSPLTTRWSAGDDGGVSDEETGEVVDQLRRWTDSGAVWEVVRRAAGGVEVALLTCDAGEEVARLRSSDPAVLAYLGGRTPDS